MPVQLALEDPELLLDRRIAERGAKEEPVELGLGQRERALLLDRVLGRDQEERGRQRPARAVDRHLPLGHPLEQRRLRLRQRAVDLVDEEDVGEDRAGPELEPPLLRVPDRQSGDVGRLQVRRALDPARRSRRRSSRRAPARAPSWPCPGTSSSRTWPFAGERREHERDLVVLAVHDRLDVAEQRAGDLGRSAECGGVRRPPLNARHVGHRNRAAGGGRLGGRPPPTDIRG